MFPRLTSAYRDDICFGSRTSSPVAVVTEFSLFVARTPLSKALPNCLLFSGVPEPRQLIEQLRNPLVSRDEAGSWVLALCEADMP